MDGIKHSRRFAELEALMGSYFRHHLVPVMTQTQSYLTEKQGEEMKAYSTSLGGILGMMASCGQLLADPYQTLKVTGEWNSKTTEDYIGMCKDRILSSEEMQHDLAYMAGQWRDVVVKEVGRERYDKLSQELGCDLAYAFVDYRRATDDRPTGQGTYAQILGGLHHPQGWQNRACWDCHRLWAPPLAEEIEKRGEVAYRPSKLEKGAGWVLGQRPIRSCWAVRVRGRPLHGSSVGYGNLSRCRPFLEGGNAAALCRGGISKGVFGSDSNVFDSFRKEAASIPGKENTASCRSQRKVAKEDTDCKHLDFMDLVETDNRNMPWREETAEEERKRVERYKDVPMVVAPGQEEAYQR